MVCMNNVNYLVSFLDFVGYFAVSMKSSNYSIHAKSLMLANMGKPSRVY